jgi:hypothetical protein
LTVTNYRGIKAADVAIGEHGAVVKGPNGAGKTTVLSAIRAALAAQGVAPEDIHLGEDKAEILVDLDALKVRRSITKKGSSLTVTNAEGLKYPSPQTRLGELLGTCALDPLGFYLAKPAERRKMVLEAIPLRVTVEQLERWAPGSDIDDIDTLAGMHGLEAIETLRRQCYDARKEANRRVKEAAAVAAQASAEADRLNGLAPDGQYVPPEDAERALRGAEAALRTLQAQQAAAARAQAATEKTRERARGWRDKAATIIADAPAEPSSSTIAAAVERANQAEARHRGLEAELAKALAEMQQAVKVTMDHQRSVMAAQDARDKAARLTSEADALEASLADVDSMGVPEDAIRAAELQVSDARTGIETSKRMQEALKASQDASEAEGKAAERKAIADALDKVVDTLTHEAPRELAASPDMIPGLAFSDDGITLDGVPVDSLSGAEQMRFAVALAKRANAKSKILVVDKLEALDPESMKRFVREATADGWQLLATRVDGGEFRVEAIELEGEAA